MRLRISSRWLALAAMLSLAGGILPCRAAQDTTPKTVTCSLSNRAYSGWCRVTEKVPEDSTPEAVCKSVLACLNDVACTKTYCNATTVRANWKLEGVRVVPAKK